ncbi:MAG: helix-turn-helix domain-containing protein [Bacteroidales bacterium]|nr:helix-turn-helix domain-containing protein [Bacteroidales bacterium]MBR1774345.1 helix-turn-helix domain-containing protein [Bacteroidales bacterium]
MTSSEVKRIRTALGLTQSEFAKKLGVHLNTVVYWESGKTKRISNSNLSKLENSQEEVSNVIQKNITLEQQEKEQGILWEQREGQLLSIIESQQKTIEKLVNKLQ